MKWSKDLSGRGGREALGTFGSEKSQEPGGVDDGVCVLQGVTVRGLGPDWARG